MFNLEKHKDSIAAINDCNEELKYSDLIDFSEVFYSWVGKRTLIFIMCKNCFSSLKGYVACIEKGIVPLLLDAGMDKELLDNLIHVYQPEFIWGPCDSHLNESYQSENSDGAYSLWKTGYDCPELFEELGLLLNTSGSTGASKLVRQSYRNVESNMMAIADYLNLDAGERPITTLPMQYTYGLSIINSHLYVGATILITDFGIMQKEFWAFFRDQQATSFGGVPYTYEMLKRLRIFRMDLPSLKTMTQAGGKLTPELHKEFAEYAKESGRQFIVMYGQTEATARMSYLPADKSLEKYGSMGIAIPGGKFSIIDAEGNEIVAPETVGELVYEGENVTLGYAENRQDLKLGDERKGRLVTGDMAKFDEDGFFYIVGRKKRFLKIFGNRVNLDEVDRLVKTEFNNIECASSGTDDHLYIFITEDTFRDDIKKYVSEKTGLNHVAIKVKTIESIPKSDSGKVLYTELNKLCD